MNRQIARKRDTGEAGNPGHFGSTARAESDVLFEMRDEGPDMEGFLLSGNPNERDPHSFAGAPSADLPAVLNPEGCHQLLLDDKPSGIVEQYEKDAHEIGPDWNGDFEIGYSIEAVRAIEAKTSSTYWKYGFREGGFGPVDHNAGEVAHFDGVTGAEAKRLLRELPSASLDEAPSLGMPPSTRELLRLAARKEGKIELTGSIYGPTREDEGIRVWGVRCYDPKIIEAYRADEDPGKLAQKLGLRRKNDSFERPDLVKVDESPWRPGEPVLRIEWDV